MPTAKPKCEYHRLGDGTTLRVSLGGDATVEQRGGEIVIRHAKSVRIETRLEKDAAKGDT